MKNRVTTYLAIALTTYCNYHGFKILEYVDVLRKYKERLDIVFSVDSISEYLDNVHFHKYLSSSVIETTKILKENEIQVRYNIVVTRINEREVRELILKAVDEMHVNVKLLDLNKFSEYLGNGKILYNEEAFDLWENLFVPMKNFYGFLEEISNNSESEWTTGVIGKGHGISMSVYFRNENWIQVKDSERGAKYSEFCKEKCEYYKKGNCQEGIFSLFLSSNLILHLSGCKNETIHFDLSKCENAQMKIAFSKLLSLI